MDLAEAAYRVTSALPKMETYGLMAQIRSAAASVPANIAEGYGRGSSGAYLQFLRIARGSLKELETQIILAQRVGLFSGSHVEPLLAQSECVGKMLNALINSVKSRGDNRQLG